MKLLAVVALIVVLFIVIYLIAETITDGQRSVRKWFRSRERRTGLWKVDEEAQDESVVVRVIEPGTDRALLVGEAPFAHDDFDMQLEVIRAEARQKVLTLNNERK